MQLWLLCYTHHAWQLLYGRVICQPPKSLRAVPRFQSPEETPTAALASPCKLQHNTSIFCSSVINYHHIQHAQLHQSIIGLCLRRSHQPRTVMLRSERRAFHTLALLALGVMSLASQMGASSRLMYTARPLCAPDQSGSGLGFTALQDTPHAAAAAASIETASARHLTGKQVQATGLVPLRTMLLRRLSVCAIVFASP